MASVIFSKSSDVNDSIFGKSQEPVRAVITQGVEAFEAHSLLSTVFSMDTSSSFAEKYTSETSLGDFEDVGENGAYPKAGMVEGFSKVIEPTTWKSSFEVTQELVEDAKFGKVKSRASIFTTSYNRTREKFGAAKTLWIYTGCTLEQLKDPSSRWRTGMTDEILSMTDVLVDGPFIEELKDISLQFRGSSNQRILKKPFFQKRIGLP